jgi:hypothetical protein
VLLWLRESVWKKDACYFDEELFLRFPFNFLLAEVGVNPEEGALSSE